MRSGRQAAKYVNPILIALILKGLARYAPGLTRGRDELASLMRTRPLRVPVTEKQRLLELALAQGGPRLLLRLGRALEGETSYPLLYVLLNSRSPTVLVDKLQRLDRYFHSDHRLELVDSGPGRLVVDHVSLTGSAPSAAENLFVCGILIALLEKIGCKELRCGFPHSEHPDRRIYEGGEFIADVPLKGCGRWEFIWSDFQPRTLLEGLDETILKVVDPQPLANTPRMTSAVEKVLVQDLGRRWTLNHAAACLQVSARSLQRKLHEEGQRFSRILSDSRRKEAARLLAGSDSSITDTAYCCGFSDSAHLSRQFKKAYGVTPSVFRKTAERQRVMPRAANPLMSPGEPQTSSKKSGRDDR